MSDFYQFGQHPDADQLSAFAENALPQHEREEVLTHLATCADCREVVSYALPPFEEASPVAAAVSARPWFSGWKLAWTGGLAFAATLAVAVLLHRATTAPVAVPIQTAENRSADSARITTVSPPAPVETAPPAVTSARVPAVAKAAPPLASTQKPEAIPELSLDNLPVNNRSFSALPPAPQAESAVGSPAAGQAFSLRTTPQQATSNFAAAATPAPAPLAVLNRQALAARSNAVTVSAAAADMATYDTVIVSPLHSGLPSRLGVASVVSHGNDTLALDTAGGLFLSTDHGMRWTAVVGPWGGGRPAHLQLVAHPAAFHGAMLSTGTPSLRGAATIDGIVTDATGAAIPGASVRLGNGHGPAAPVTLTGADGRFAFFGPLAPGQYPVSVQAPGFQAMEREVQMTNENKLTLAFQLPVGQATETVEVNAGATGALALESLKARKKTALQAKPGMPDAFQLTTESGEQWSSPDGRSWHRP